MTCARRWGRRSCGWSACGRVPDLRQPSAGFGETALRVTRIDRALEFAEHRVFAFARLAPANGRTDFSERTVTLHHDLPGAQQTKTLAHELAHIRLHAPEVRPDNLTRDRAEVEAESVAYVVTAAHGLATDEYTVPYVTGWADGDLELVASTATRVLSTARTILRSVDELAAQSSPPPGVELSCERSRAVQATRSLGVSR
jgi:hypothetical protein